MVARHAGMDTPDRRAERMVGLAEGWPRNIGACNAPPGPKPGQSSKCVADRNHRETQVPLDPPEWLTALSGWIRCPEYTVVHTGQQSYFRQHASSGCRRTAGRQAAAGLADQVGGAAKPRAFRYRRRSARNFGDRGYT